MKKFRCLRECSGECVKKHLAENAIEILLENALGVWFREIFSKNSEISQISSEIFQSIRECSREFLKKCLVVNASGNPFTNVSGNASRTALGMLHGTHRRLLNIQWLAFLLFWETSWSVNKRKAVKISQVVTFRNYCKFGKHLAIRKAYFQECNITNG